jgi:hypothetical protein
MPACPNSYSSPICIIIICLASIRLVIICLIITDTKKKTLEGIQA